VAVPINSGGGGGGEFGGGKSSLPIRNKSNEERNMFTGRLYEFRQGEGTK